MPRRRKDKVRRVSIPEPLQRYPGVNLHNVWRDGTRDTTAQLISQDQPGGQEIIAPEASQDEPLEQHQSRAQEALVSEDLPQPTEENQSEAQEAQVPEEPPQQTEENQTGAQDPHVPEEPSQQTEENQTGAQDPHVPEESPNQPAQQGPPEAQETQISEEQSIPADQIGDWQNVGYRPWEYGTPLSVFEIGLVITAPVHVQDYNQGGEASINRTISNSGLWIYSKIRWLIVVEVHHYHCVVLPIYTHGGSGIQYKRNREEYIGIRDSETRDNRSQSVHGNIYTRRLPEWEHDSRGHTVKTSAYAHFNAPIAFNKLWPCRVEGHIDTGQDLRRLLELYYRSYPDEDIYDEHYTPPITPQFDEQPQQNP